MKPIDVIGIEVPSGTLDLLARDLAHIFRSSCRVRPESLDPLPAFSDARGQYFSTALLAALSDLAGGRNRRVLAVTSLDLFVPVLTFVFGEAQLAGDCAIVSLHRLREEFYGLPPRGELLRDRLLKEAVHELGHTFGLVHCDDWSCVMASSHAVEALDVKTANFCAGCWKTVAAERRAVSFF